MAFAVPITSLKQLQELARDHGEEEGFSACFVGVIEKLSEAKAMERLMARMADEAGWKIQPDGLHRFVAIDDTLGKTNWLLVRILATDADVRTGSSTDADVRTGSSAAADARTGSSASDARTCVSTADVRNGVSSTRQVGRAAARSTDMTSPDYGTAEFAHRLAMEFLRGRGRPLHRDDARSSARSVSTRRPRGRALSAERLQIGVSSDHRASAEHLTVEAAPNRRSSSKQLCIGVSPDGRVLSAERLTVARRSSSKQLRIGVSPDGRAPSAERPLVDAGPSRRSSSKQLRIGFSPDGHAPADILQIDGTHGRVSPERHPIGVSPGDRSSTDRVATGPTVLLPALRFMPPAVAELLLESGRKLMQMPLRKVRLVGQHAEMVGRRLKMDTEEVDVLREALKELRREVIAIWNEGADAADFLF